MKKTKKAVLLVVCVLAMLLCTACSPRTPLTAEEFTSRMSAQGYQILDASDQFEEGAVESVSLAMTDGYQIEFFVLPSAQQAASAFAQNKEYFESIKGSVSSHSSMEASNYRTYSQSDSTGYYYVSIIDNTMVYLAVPPEYKDEVKPIVKDLGY